ISFPGVTEEFPFDEKTLVFKVMGKMFALCNVDEFKSVNLKCDPTKAVFLREEYPNLVNPGYHMNKKHWNTVSTAGNLPDEKIREWTSDSYQLVVKNLTKKDREKLKSLSKKK
ncbi:MAG: MmcQ/YjbR family DNA-binding protein, partial [Balneolaceae bacterium]